MSHDTYALNRSSVAVLALSVSLVCSVTSNYFQWRWGNTQAHRVQSANFRLLQTQAELRLQTDHAQLLKAMLGHGMLTQAEIEALRNGTTGNPDVDAIASSYIRDMDLFAPDFDLQNRSYPTLVTYLDFTKSGTEFDVLPDSEAQN